MAVLESRINSNIKDSGVILPGDFIINPATGVAEATAAYSAAIGNANITVTMKTVGDCFYIHTFPITSTVGFTIQLATANLSGLVQVCWCAMGNPL